MRLLTSHATGSGRSDGMGKSSYITKCPRARYNANEAGKVP
jgi:hypothetical protein